MLSLGGMSLKTVLCILSFSFISNITFAQGDENLLLQYRIGPDITIYRKWNFDLHLRGVMISPNGEYTSPKIGYVLGGLYNTNSRRQLVFRLE